MQVSTAQHTMGHTCREILGALEGRGFQAFWCARHEQMPAEAWAADLYLGWPEDLATRCEALPADIPAIALSLTEHYASYEEKRKDAVARSGLDWFDQLPRTPAQYDAGYARANLVITYGNEHIRRSYECAGLADKLFWMPAPIDTDYFRNEPVKKLHAPFRVLAYSRDMSPRKGFHDVLAAWAVASRPDWSLVCMGVNPRPADWWPHMTRLPYPNISCVGYINNDQPAFGNVIRGAHVLLDLSPTEGGETGTMLDCGCMGIPAIASPASAIDEPDGKVGWIVDPTDPEQVAERLGWCDMNRIELAHMGSRARAHVVQQHSLPVYRERLGELLDVVHERWGPK